MRVLFVCLGNICRSPTAEGVFRKLVAERAPDAGIEIDSAGTQGYHVGEPPDERAIAAARSRGIDLSQQRARRIAEDDFERFDLILAMDQSNLAALRAKSPPHLRIRIRLLMEFARDVPELQDVPDPYYGGGNGFERVLDLVEDAASGLLDALVAGELPSTARR